MRETIPIVFVLFVVASCLSSPGVAADAVNPQTPPSLSGDVKISAEVAWGQWTFNVPALDVPRSVARRARERGREGNRVRQYRDSVASPMKTASPWTPRC